MRPGEDNEAPSMHRSGGHVLTEAETEHSQFLGCESTSVMRYGGYTP